MLEKRSVLFTQRLLFWKSRLTLTLLTEKVPFERLLITLWKQKRRREFAAPPDQGSRLPPSLTGVCGGDKRPISCQLERGVTDSTSDTCFGKAFLGHAPFRAGGSAAAPRAQHCLCAVGRSPAERREAPGDEHRWLLVWGGSSPRLFAGKDPPVYGDGSCV